MQGSTPVNNEARIPRDSSFKVLLLGDGGTGKTTFVSRFIKEPSPLKWVPNISFELHALRFDAGAHGKITLNVWDTGTFASLLSSASLATRGFRSSFRCPSSDLTAVSVDHMSSWSGEVGLPAGWVLHDGRRCDHPVRRHGSPDLPPCFAVVRRYTLPSKFNRSRANMLICCSYVVYMGRRA
jgi:hypothetical protein